MDQAQQNRHDAGHGDGGEVPGVGWHGRWVAAWAAKGKKRFSGFLAGGGVFCGGGSGGRRLVGGVAAGVDFAEVLDADLGVNGGGFEFFVAEELLDDADVGPAFEQMGGATVAQKMATAGAADAGLLEGLADAAAEDVGTEGGAVTGEEEGGFGGVEFEAGADFSQVSFEPVHGEAGGGEAERNRGGENRRPPGRGR